MIVYVDIDNTICTCDGIDYSLAQSIPENIAKINKLYEKGDRIVYWTARGTGSGIDHRELTKGQFKRWGVKHHELIFGKPIYDLLICDKTVRIEEI